MAFNPENLNEADHIPGAFPSEDTAAVSTGVTGQDTQTAHNAPLASTQTTTVQNTDEKKRDFLEQQAAAHTAGGLENEVRSAVTSSQDKTLSQDPAQTGLETSSTPASGLRNAETSSSGDTAQNAGSIGSDLATIATAVGLAAKDAFVAAKDSAVPAANAATEQAKNLAGYAQENAGPAASYTAEQGAKAATYTKNTLASGVSSDSSTDTVPTDGAMQTAGNLAAYATDTAYSAANAAQSYGPNVLGERSSISSNTQDSTLDTPLSQTSESREAIANDQPVGGKSSLEKEVLDQSHQSSEVKKPHVDLTSRIKGLEEQLAPESMTPGVVTVLGTEQDRSFPLGATDHVAST